MMLEQVIQNIRAQKFQKYDWGAAGNMEKYG
jgi:hypothetical protein